MTEEQDLVLRRCAAGALSGTLTFPEIVEQLTAAGVERYHADYSRNELTYYLPNGDSLVVPSPHPRHETGDAFRADAVAAAVRQSQRNEHTYLEFICKTMEAGCVGYFVQLAGRQVQYFGRRGEIHTEAMP